MSDSQSPTPPTAEGLPIVGYFNSHGNALCKGVPRFSTDIALTPQAPAQAQLDSLRSENERLKSEAQERALQYLSDNGQWIEETRRLRSENERLSRELEEARDDGRRLDYLDTRNARKNERNGTIYGWKLSENHNRIALEDHDWQKLSVREAIDAAMATPVDAVGKEKQ